MTSELPEGRDAYRGPASYQDGPEDRLLFFGRKNESEALLNLVLSEPLTVLFARSGIGKTSLINAGLLQALRERQFFPIVARVTGDPTGNAVKSVVQDVEKAAAKAGVEREGTPHGESLWEFFRTARFKIAGGFVRPVLILDQFEELFTKIDKSENFARDLADLVRHRVPEAVVVAESQRLSSLPIDHPERQAIVSLLYGETSPDVKVLLSLREDYLAELASLRSYLPAILHVTLRLEPLSVDQARNAIEEPGRSEVLGDDTFTFAPGVVDQMLAFLSKRIGGRGSAVGSVDPAQLNILCWHLDRIRRHKKGKKSNQINASDLGGDRGMEKILVGHYGRLLGAFPSLRPGWSARRARPSVHNLLLFSRPRAAVRRLCEHGLITRGGQRNSLMGDVIRDQYGLGEADLQQLVDARFLRTDSRLHKLFFELSHDSLIAPIRSYVREERPLQWATRLAGMGLLALLLSVPLARLWQKYEAMTAASQRQEAASQRKRAVEEAPPAARSIKVQEMLESGQSNFSGYDLRKLDLSQVAPSVSDAQKRDFSAADLSGANLKNLKQIGSSFANAHLENADLSGAFIPSANFTAADLQGADFSNAHLSLAQLVGADARKAHFTGADLTSADLSRARLEGAVFRGAELRRAKVAGAHVDEATDLSKTAWWLADGWSTGVLQRLATKAPLAAFAASDVYKARVAALSSQVQLAQGNRQRSTALNELAWFTAIAGTELEKAFSDADDALRLSPKNADALDTRGYINLRRGQYEDARRDFEGSLPYFSPTGTTAREVRYHLALACEYLNDTAAAETAFTEATRRGYRPTYELLLTPRRGTQQPAGSSAPPAAAPGNPG